MNVNQLIAVLEKERIRQDAYSITGDCSNESYVIASSGCNWQVYYYERGIKTNLVEFDNEMQACQHFLGIILNDPTTRSF